MKSNKSIQLATLAALGLLTQAKHHRQQGSISLAQTRDDEKTDGIATSTTDDMFAFS